MSMIPLKRVANIIAGQSPRSEDVVPLSEGMPFLQGNAEFGQESPRPKFECNVASKHCDVNDILISVRAPVGALNVADQKYAIGRGLCAIRAKDVDQRYLWWWVNTQDVLLEAVATGSTYVAVTAEQVGSLEVPLVGIYEQRRIADFLDSEIGRIEGVLERRIRTSELARQRHQALVDLEMDRIIREYGSCPFRRFIFQVEQGSSPLCDNNPAPEGDWGVLKVSAVKLGTFNAEENKHYTEDPGGMTRYEVHEGDLLITRANTPSFVGSAALVPRVRKKLIISDKIFRVSLSGGLDPRFLVFAAGGSRVRGICAAVAHGTSQSMVNLKSGDVKAWPIPAAPLEKQVKISEKLEESRFFAERMQGFSERQIDLLEERKRALITAAVTGQIDVTTARGADLS